jgi:hypothetical protein
MSQMVVHRVLVALGDWPSMEKRTVGIIGAGVSGLATAEAFFSRG